MKHQKLKSRDLECMHSVVSNNKWEQYLETIH